MGHSGPTSPGVFNPTSMDTDQWAAAAMSAGTKYGVLTTKHHHGFALWDTTSNTHDGASSPYQGDVTTTSLSIHGRPRTL
jgi:alpha-L-fucosidase